MTVEKKYRPRCFFDVEVGGQSIGRIVFELYSDVCPITCENFRCLCTGEKGIGKSTEKPLHYKNTIFHRIVKGFMVQGGDFSAGNGSGGESIYGGTFPDENFELNHDTTFCLSMANRGKDTNGSQFFITTLPAPHLDGVHVVFGHVISGQEIVTEVETQLTDQSSRPFTDVRIFNCGELVLKSKSKSKHRKSDKASSPLEEGEMSDDKSKHKKKHKKHSKKNKKEKSRRKDDDEVSQSDLSRAKREMELDCSVRADEIPDIPTNNFLMRRGPAESGEQRRPQFRSEGYLRRTKISKSGRKIKGRGHMRYRTPSPEGSRSGSETPPHWRQAQSRVRSLKEVLEEKRKQLEELEAQESNEEEMQDNQGPKIPPEEDSDRFRRGHREVSKEQFDFQRREEFESTQDQRSHDPRSGSSRHSERSGIASRGHYRERPSTRKEETAEGRGGREAGRRREHRSHRRRDDSEEEYDSSTSPVRKGIQSTVISKVVYQNKPSEIVTTPTVRVVRRFTEEKQTKSKHEEREKRPRSSSYNSKSPTGVQLKQNVEEGERNGVGSHRHHRDHRHHHRHKVEKAASEPVTEDTHAELGQSPMASLEVDKDVSIVDMDCTPIIHQTNEEDNTDPISPEKKLPKDVYLPNPAQIMLEKQELYQEPEAKVSDSPRIRIPGLGSDDESDGSVEEEPPPPPGTEDIVLFKNYPPAMPPMSFVAESKELLKEAELYEAVPKSIQQEKFIPVPPLPEKEIPVQVAEIPRQRLPFLDDDTDDEVGAPPDIVLPVSVTATAASPQQKMAPSPEKVFLTSSNEAAKPTIEEKNVKEKRSPSPRRSEVKEREKPRLSTKPAESSRNSRTDRSSSRSRAPRRRSRSRSRSPRRGSSPSRRRSLSRGRKRPSPGYRNRSPIWRRSSDYRRPVDVGRRRRSPSPSRRRSRSHSRTRSRRTPPRYNRRRSRSASRGRRGKRSRSSSSSSSSSSNSSRRRPKRGRKPSRSRSSSSSSSHSSSSSSSSSSS